MPLRGDRFQTILPDALQVLEMHVPQSRPQRYAHRRLHVHRADAKHEMVRSEKESRDDAYRASGRSLVGLARCGNVGCADQVTLGLSPFCAFLLFFLPILARIE